VTQNVKRGAKRKRGAPIVVERRGERSTGRGVTYQLELVLCGKPKCRKRHGPYWYAYWTAGSRTRKRYIGKQWKPLHDVEAAAAEKAVLGNSVEVLDGRELPKTGLRRGPRRAEKGRLTKGGNALGMERPKRPRRNRSI
jgi:hypothetical protein